MEIKQIKYLGEQAISYLIEKCKATFALITHTHTAEEIGADAKGSASAALGLANEYTDEQIEAIASGNTVVKESEHSSTADTATEATHATNADNATHAESADEAEHATLADMATSATQDADGNVITEVYETKVDAQIKLDEAKEYTDVSIAAIPSDVLIINVTGSSSADYTSSKSYEEIREALNNDIIPFVVYDSYIYTLIDSYDSFVFSLSFGTTIRHVHIHKSGNIDINSTKLQTPSGNVTTTDKTLVGAINELNANKANISDIESTYETKTDASEKLSESKAYTDTAVANLVNSAPEKLDTLGELATAMTENDSLIETLNAAITNKADAVHIHEITDITGLKEDLAEINTSLANKSDLDHNHDTIYYTQAQIDEMELIALDEIDEICGSITEGSMLESDVDELMEKLEG